MKKRSLRVAVVGATGAVGREIVSILEERDFPLSQLTLLASGRSEGTVLPFKNTEVSVQKLTKSSFANIDIALFSAGSRVSELFCPLAVQSGTVCVDNTSAFRMDPKTPLVVPEVNPEDLNNHRGIIANPNCSTIQMLVALAPIHRDFIIKKIFVSTYQAVSGAGNKAIVEMKKQIDDFLKGQIPKPEVFAHPIAFNCLPHIDIFSEKGFTKEELKMIHETRKILKTPKMPVTVTAVRVPVFRSHSESVAIEVQNQTSVKEITELLNRSSGVCVCDNPSKNQYPLAMSATGTDAVFVGRIREDYAVKNSYLLWVVADNLRKGAALNAVQIAEILLEKNLLL